MEKGVQNVDLQTKFIIRITSSNNTFGSCEDRRCFSEWPIILGVKKVPNMALSVVIIHLCLNISLIKILRQYKRSSEKKPTMKHTDTVWIFYKRSTFV